MDILRKNIMPSYSTIYRHANPEYYQKEKEATGKRIMENYNNNPEYREMMKKKALERYYKKKEEKLQQQQIKV